MPAVAGSTWPRAVSLVTMSRHDDVPVWLRDADRQLAGGYSSARRTEWLLGRAALQCAVASWCAEHGTGEIDPAGVRIRAGALGEPRLESRHGRPISVSLAHGGTLVVAVATGGEHRLGVDVEPEHRDVSRLHASLLPAERSLVDDGMPALHVLMAKEAASKAWQIGLGGALQRWPVHRGPASSLSVRGPDREPLVVDLHIVDGHVIALCLAHRAIA